MNIKTTLKTSVAAAALFAIAAPVATPASADIASGNKNKLVVSGQVVRALYYADDGQNEQLFNSTGNTANTRVRWVASGTLNENVTAGALIEFDVQTSNTGGSFGAAGSALQDVDVDKTNWSIRHQYIWVNHKKFGKVSLGATDAAANGYTEFTLAGVGGISTPNNLWTGAGISFLETGTTTTGSSTGVSPGSVLSNLDFTSRTDVIRYDTPDFMGFGLSVSLDGAGGGEVGGKYTGKIGPVNLIAAVGYSQLAAKSTTTEYNLAGSIAARHESGINASFHVGKLEIKETTTNRGTPAFWAASVGYQAKVFKVGGTNMRAVYNQSKQISRRGDDADSWGIDVQQNFDAIGATLSLVYRNYDYENLRQLHTSIDSIDVIGLQAAFNF